ncbi:hypothetical protein LSH36_122g00025, partial [Paralvinella palmiformis]
MLRLPSVNDSDNRSDENITKKTLIAEETAAHPGMKNAWVEQASVQTAEEQKKLLAFGCSRLAKEVVGKNNRNVRSCLKCFSDNSGQGRKADIEAINKRIRENKLLSVHSQAAEEQKKLLAFGCSRLAKEVVGKNNRNVRSCLKCFSDNSGQGRKADIEAINKRIRENKLLSVHSQDISDDEAESEMTSIGIISFTGGQNRNTGNGSNHQNSNGSAASSQTAASPVQSSGSGQGSSGGGGNGRDEEDRSSHNKVEDEAEEEEKESDVEEIDDSDFDTKEKGNGRDEEDRSSHNKVEDEAEEEEKESDVEEIDDSDFDTKEK